jgi:hypothetical protein
MLFLKLPRTFRVGDTAPCQVNGQKRSVTWADPFTLLLGPDDARRILHTFSTRDGQEFVCENRVSPEDGGPPAA